MTTVPTPPSPAVEFLLVALTPAALRCLFERVNECLNNNWLFSKLERMEIRTFPLSELPQFELTLRCPLKWETWLGTIIRHNLVPVSQVQSLSAISPAHVSKELFWATVKQANPDVCLSYEDNSWV